MNIFKKVEGMTKNREKQVTKVTLLLFFFKKKVKSSYDDTNERNVNYPMIQRIPTRSHVIVPVSNVVAVMTSARQEGQDTLTGHSLIDWQATTATGWDTTVTPRG